MLQGFLMKCTDFLSIGFSGNDDHVLKLFSLVNEVKKVRIVSGTSEGAKNTLKKFNSFNTKFPIATDEKGFAPYIYGGGFNNYIKDRIIDSFFA
jgi:hypothetical protein